MQLDATSLWLREEFGNRAFFPDSTNSYSTLPSDVNRLVVEGSPQAARPAATQVATPMPGPSGTGTASPYPYRPFFHRKSQTINVKVVRASMKRLANGKCEFSNLGQTFVDVTEPTSNVNYIRNAVQKRWREEYTLATADGLEIEDSSGTQGVFSYYSTCVHALIIEPFKCRCA